MKKIILLFIIAVALYSCQKKSPQLSEGIWRAELVLVDSQILPFTFEMKRDSMTYTLEIVNAEEKILVDEIKIWGDSIRIMLPVFDSEIIGTFTKNLIQGKWINHARKNNNLLSFSATFGENFRFPKRNSTINVSGKWEVTFSPNTNDSSKAIGIFSQKDNIVTGTFLTPTGDYRYLEGAVSNDSLLLSCFDGSHAFLFTAKLHAENIMSGNFFSGLHFQEKWIAKRNEKFSLPNPDSLTYLKKGYEKFDFSFLDLDSNLISLTDATFKDKVVIVQIMGSWCPNCMDESAFLASYYQNHKEEGIEIIALAFEKTNDFTKAKSNLLRLKKRFDINYPILIAGQPNKENVAKVLPMLNHVMSYPTTIFIDKKGIVRKIHTGYSGPATGKYYDDFLWEFNLFVEKLAKE